MKETMKGQWIGKYEGTLSGDLMVNIDEMRGYFEGVAYASSSDEKSLISVIYLQTKNKNNKYKGKAFVNPVDPRNGYQCEWEDIKHLYPEGMAHSNEAEVTLEIIKGKLYIEAVSDIGVILKSVLTKPIESEKSKVPSKNMSWKEFKAYISKISKSKYLFRGQTKQWGLRTSFHRGGRYRINKFIENDVKLLHQRLSAITPHYFDLLKADENGAFFNLLQHHGYPTPLLDWSFSPYVSAFFAFRNWPIKYEGDGYARIYIFDNEAWQKRYKQFQNIDPPFPHLSVMSFIAIDNPRLVPQQAVTTVTNIDDIEAYLLDREAESGDTFIYAIDIPANEREKAMVDLKFMGITAGSMFPSIDGVCEELREQNFDK